MKIALLSSASAGGAGIAAFRVFEALKSQKNHRIDFIDIPTLVSTIDEVSPQQSVTNKKISNTHFTMDYANGYRGWLIDMLSKYDCLNIHWCSYLLSIAEILALAKLGKKILFTMHDFYFITGGCHYPAGCTGYTGDCSGCPQVDEGVYRRESVIHALKLKREIFAHPNVHLSAPSQYIVDSAVESGVIPEERGHVMRNAYDPVPTLPVSVSPNVFSLLLIADSFLEERKGIELAINSIIEFCRSHDKQDHEFHLHVVGTCEKDIAELLADSDLSLILHGHVRSHTKLVEIFQQCQFMLTCSYEDNWPNILVEAGAYGCIPIVGKGHGCEEFCREFDISLVATDYTAESFAECLQSAFESANDNRRDEPKKQFIESIRAMHSYSRVSGNYIELFLRMSETNDLKKKGIQSLETMTASNSATVVSENFLGQATRSILTKSIRNHTKLETIQLSVEDTPFTTQTITSNSQLIVIYDDQSSQQLSMGNANCIEIPINENGRHATSVFMPKSNSFGLRQVLIQRRPTTEQPD